MEAYTVILLKPEWDRVGPEDEWTFIAHGVGNSVSQAVSAARDEASFVANDPEDYVVLAVYAGKHDNLSHIL